MATVPRSGAHSWDISSASAADPVEASKSGPDVATTPMTKATPMVTSATAPLRNASVGARVHGAVRSSVCEPDCIGGTCRLGSDRAASGSATAIPG